MGINEQETIDRLGKLGLKTASDKLKRLAEKKRKLAIAYEHYRFVRMEKVQDFNQKLKEKTMKREANGYEKYQKLSFTPIDEYSEIPPDSVLASLENAVNRNCFDSFEIAHIVDVVKVPDPILFARINGCTDRFFIDQWDDDVSIEDILKPNEG
jgi:hypothetical protein